MLDWPSFGVASQLINSVQDPNAKTTPQILPLVAHSHLLSARIVVAIVRIMTPQPGRDAMTIDPSMSTIGPGQSGLTRRPERTRSPQGWPAALGRGGPAARFGQRDRRPGPSWSRIAASLGSPRRQRDLADQ